MMKNGPLVPDDETGNSVAAWTAGATRFRWEDPLGDVPPARRRQFAADVDVFLRGPFAAQAVALGWGALDLFGCDGDRRGHSVGCYLNNAAFINQRQQTDGEKRLLCYS
jgi:hypothetical protein